MKPLHRREFLRLTALTGAALYASPLEALQVRRGRPKRVLILGAGLAGLVAGLELQKAGHQVTILEAQRRSGGRVLTLREPFADGLYAEAGAGRIPPHHDLTLKYVRHFGLTLDPFFPTNGNDVAYVGGKRVVVPRGQHLSVDDVPYQLTAAERRLGFAGMYDRYIHQAVARLPEFRVDQPLPAALHGLDRQTIAEFMRKQGASADAIRYFLLGFEDSSAADFLRDSKGHDVPQLQKIRGGNDLLPRALADRLRGIIRYGAPVVRIAQTDTGVSATVSVAGVESVIEADEMICTLPFAVLRNIAVSPAFSERKAEIIEKMYYGAVSRVFLQMHDRFWRRQGLSGFATTDAAIEIWNPDHNYTRQRGILMLYIYEDEALKVQKMDPDARVQWGAGLMEKVHPGSREHLEGGTSYAWHENPWQRGAYTVMLPGQMQQFYPWIAQREGRIHFAGEHCSDWPGWIQGALHSGLRAAHAVSATNS